MKPAVKPARHPGPPALELDQQPTPIFLRRVHSNPDASVTLTLRTASLATYECTLPYSDVLPLYRYLDRVVSS